MDTAALVIPAAAELMDGRVSDQLVSLSTDRCSSVIGQKEQVDGPYMPESTSGNIMAYSELSRSSAQDSSFHCQDTQEELKFASSSMSSIEGKQIRRKYGKMASSSGGFSKRSRMGMMEDLLSKEFEANDVKEKSQITKPKNGLNGKRVDRRNGKASMKSKYEFFSLKGGMVSFNSGSGGNNSLGICGLKPDAYDVTKHLDELTVKELLDGHYKGPTLAKDKGKKAANLNDNFVNALRKGCSILQRKKPLKIQSSAEIDGGYNLSISEAPMCVDTSKNDDEKRGTCVADLLSLSKVPPKVLDFRLCQPKDILECVALPPPVDLDDLLVDAAKLVIFAKDIIDSRGKQISHRASLAYADAGTCRSKWVKIENTTARFEGRTSFLSEFDSLNYDPKLVPVKSMNSLPPGTHTAPSASINFPFIDFGSSSSATCSRVSPLSSEYGSNLKHEEHAGDSPRSWAAAQTLCDIKQLWKQDQYQKMMWKSKFSDKTIKACTSKPNNKLGEIFAKPELVVLSHGPVKSKDTWSISKKPRLLINENGKDLNTGTKGLVNWHVPRSSTRTPNKSYRDTYTNITGYNSFTMPPPSSRVFDKACSSCERLR